MYLLRFEGCVVILDEVMWSSWYQEKIAHLLPLYNAIHILPYQLCVTMHCISIMHFYDVLPLTSQRAMRSIRQLQTQLSKAELQCYQAEEQTAALRLSLDLALTACRSAETPILHSPMNFRWSLQGMEIIRCRLGQALVVAGKNPSKTTGTPTVNVGVSNLPLTVKTDIANRCVYQPLLC